MNGVAAFEYFYRNILDNLEAGLSTLDSFYQEYNAKTDDEKFGFSFKRQIQFR